VTCLMVICVGWWLRGWNAIWEVKWGCLMKWMWVMNDEYPWVINDENVMNNDMWLKHCLTSCKLWIEWW
jgi:hypothetical protein